MPVAENHSVLVISLWIVGGLVVIAVVAAFLSRALIRRGLREPFVVRMINRTADGSSTPLRSRSP